MAYTDQYFKIDVNELIKLSPGKYKFNNEKLDNVILEIGKEVISIGNEDIWLEQQEANYGEKKFFLCPYCMGKRKHLYYVDESWKCRECGNLKYRSTVTYRNGMDHCDLKIDKILDKLKLEHNISYYTGDLIPYIKPKGMRWTTYSNLIEELRYWQCERANRWFNLVGLYLKR